ncbi:exodeoxyribonuclease V subunit beta [Burkholderia sp. WAC0059]|uniref:exodeoxyribonuclease V subunit beta n=1 Tax=Burkholderia sp. WAC0059 TaxID=2066022 RepID=UPI000C7E9695|nr:exodeoxyribonuclease V subunit beta [Burkholderia sp. WAC0059]PLZ02924.1 exodeoxyribonuclease V subunit beta [Burkholderia sp. WAC0059]
MTRTSTTRAGASAAVLHPLRFALRGSSLIEASAGTGKTFTIAMLYVRLVLGHGSTRALMPPEILVVTFTDAATRELRERIRTRLVEAAAYFRADPGEIAPRAANEDLLHDLRGEYAPDDWAACARRLELAAEWMDEAAVSTIHGWCNRMLSEHAFDSDSLFSQTLVTDQSELRAEVVRDYWRTFLAPLDAQDAAEVRQRFASPDALLAQMRGLTGYAAQLPEGPAPRETLAAARLERRDYLAKLKAPWSGWIDEIRTLFEAAKAKKQYDARRLNARNLENWLGRLHEWATEPERDRPALDERSAAWTRLTPDGLREIWTTGEPPAHPAWAALESLPAALDAQPNAWYDLLCHAARWVERRFADEEAKRSQMGFDDLLTRLHAALQKPNGARLAEIIRRQYPVALIDEFQDTDPVQYGIFDLVYRIECNDPDTAIVLIGDPKQAIYAFRGADIYTYLQARRACEGRLHTLVRNFRSTAQMVAAVNRCFEAAETRPEGAGAFLFRSPDDEANPLPFVAAEAQGRQDRLEAGGVALPALNAWWLPPAEDGKPLSREAYFRQMAASCASEMARLLNLGQRGEAGFAGARGTKPLVPADMAVLVNNRDEARAIRAALAVRGVRSVYLSDRDSVFQTDEAGELRHWLAACAEPDDGRLVRTALATATLGLDWAELDALNRDELAWERRVLDFRGYRECWRKQGVLPMLRRLFNDYRVPQRLLGQTAGEAVGGERVLTNLLHLAELLQQASRQLDGEHALLRYLDEQRGDEGANAGGDARQLRLESDAGLVQVVTIHKSKGLEYPLVFLPFACSYRAAKITDMPLKWHDDEGRLHVSPGDPAALARADRERLGEDLRKLYVALTRARYATWVGLAPIPGVEASAFGYLLDGGRPVEPARLGALLARLRGECEGIAVAEAPAASDDPFVPLDERQVHGAARSLSRRVSEHWWIASYSSLRKDPTTISGPSREIAGAMDGMDGDEAGAAPAVAIEGATMESDVQDGARVAPETRREDVFRDLHEAGTLADDASGPSFSAPPAVSIAQAALSFGGALHDFPRGADAGSFLHGLMESAAAEGFATLSRDRRRMRDMIARRCNLAGWARWIDPLTDWMLHLLREPLALPPVRGKAVPPVVLADLKSYMAEMEFWLAAHRVETPALDALVTRFTLDGAERPALEPARLNGMLKGFIDLVFEHGGRYYVADYKSNWLGPDDADYTGARMRQQILHARYELQYVLYLFALHRLLRTRVPDYDYDRHVGGAVYLFLRGSRSAGQGLHVERPPRELIERLDALFEHGGGTPEPISHDLGETP